MCTSRTGFGSAATLVDDLVERHRVGARLVLLRREGAEVAGRDAHVRVVDVRVPDEVRGVAVALLAHVVGELAEAEEVVASGRGRRRPRRTAAGPARTFSRMGSRAVSCIRAVRCRGGHRSLRGAPRPDPGDRALAGDACGWTHSGASIRPATERSARTARTGVDSFASLSLYRPRTGAYTACMRFAAALVGLAVVATPAAAKVAVRVSGGQVELTATAAPLADILDRLARQTGMKVVYEGPAPRQLVTLSLRGRTPTETVLALFEGLGLDFALVADPSGARVQTLVVAGTAAVSPAASSAANAGRSPGPAAMRRPFGPPRARARRRSSRRSRRTATPSRRAGGRPSAGAEAADAAGVAEPGRERQRAGSDPPAPGSGAHPDAAVDALLLLAVHATACSPSLRCRPGLPSRPPRRQPRPSRAPRRTRHRSSQARRALRRRRRAGRGWPCGREGASGARHRRPDGPAHDAGLAGEEEPLVVVGLAR